jgi:prepilin-type N-terminal cleavage/methylation domain-containing protein
MKTARPRRGTTLLEVLIAMAIMALMIVGILQMFFVALSINIGSSARTQLTFKAQQVAENIRYLQYMAQQYSAAPSGTGVLTGQSMTAGSYNLPYLGSESEYAYWGPNGVNVIEGPKMPYRLSYSVADNTQSNTWVVTVTAVPVQASSGAAQGGTELYRGTNVLKQKVQYVFSMHK